MLLTTRDDGYSLWCVVLSFYLCALPEIVLFIFSVFPCFCSGRKKHENAHTNFELLSSILNNVLETKMNAIPHTHTQNIQIYKYTKNRELRDWILNMGATTRAYSRYHLHVFESMSLLRKNYMLVWSPLFGKILHATFTKLTTRVSVIGWWLIIFDTFDIDRCMAFRMQSHYTCHFKFFHLQK